MADLLWYLVKWTFLFIAIWAVFKFLLSPKKRFAFLNSTWYHLFSEQQISTLDFYKSVTEKIEAKNVKTISINIVEYGEKFLHLGKRQYLQIVRNEEMLLICAAPFGNDFFVSWRSGEPSDALREFFNQLPIIGKSLEKANNYRTFYRIDTDAMFRSMVHTCVLAAIDDISDAKGVRRLSELERRPTELQLQSLNV